MREKGIIIKISEAAKITGLSYQFIRSRLDNGTLSRPKALDLPNAKKRTLRVYENEVLALIEAPIIPQVAIKLKKTEQNKNYDHLFDF